jgi:hypothetical protein
MQENINFNIWYIWKLPVGVAAGIINQDLGTLLPENASAEFDKQDLSRFSTY